ncbi:hypothetical protein Tco_1227244 [Tanacetum coccineum]
MTINGEGVNWTSHSEEEDYALMAYNSSGSDTEVISCSKECKESYAELKKLYDKQRAQLSDASIEILSYTQALKKVEAQLVAHQQAEKEKEDLKAKVEKWHNSSKNLGKLLNTQMSANDKFGLGYGDHRYDGILSYENEVLQSVFMNKESDLENQPLYDRFVTAEGMHADYPHRTLQNKGIVDNGCSRHMRKTRYLLNIKTLMGGPLHFGGSNVTYTSEKKNKVLFTDSECLVLSPEFKLPDANQVLLRIPRQNNMYSFNLENIVPSGGLACLIAKATIFESNKWHRRLGHVNLKNLNKFVKGNLNLRTVILLNSVGQKGSRGNTVMPELHNKMELLKERTGPLLRLLGLLTKPSHKTPYELYKLVNTNHKYIRPLGAIAVLLNTIDHLGKFDGKSDEGFLVGFNELSTCVDQRNQRKQTCQDYFVLPIWSSYSSTVKRSTAKDVGFSAVADFTNLEPVVNVSPIPTSRINSIHPSTLILGDPQSQSITRKQ